MDLNRLTQKSQEALQEAQSIGVRHGHQEVDVEHLASRSSTSPTACCRGFSRVSRHRPSRFAGGGERELERRPRVSGPGIEPGKVYVTQRLQQLLVRAEDEAKRLKDEYVSVEHLVARAPRRGAAAARRPGSSRSSASPATPSCRRSTAVRGNQRVTSANPEGAYEALEKYGVDLVAQARARQARPGHRPRRRDPPRHPHPVAQDQEQPGADRRARRRQDRDRRGAGPAHRARRRARSG